MHILILLPHPLVPADRGNKQLTLNVLRYIARHHDCHVIGFHEPGRQTQQAWTQLEAMFPRVKVLEVFEQVSGLRLHVERIRCLLTLRPLVLARYRNRAMQQRLQSLDLSLYDIVLCDMYTVAEWRAPCSSRPCVLIASDAYSLAGFRVVRDARNFFTRARCLIEAVLQLQFERREYPRFDIVSTVSESAADWLRKIAPRGVYRFVPVPVNEALLDEGAAAHPGKAPPVLLCWEGIAHEAVATRVAAFIRLAWPDIFKAIPGSELVLWGEEPLPFLRKLIAETPGVHHIGYVDDWLGTLKKAAVFVFPHRATAGMHVKLMSAFAVGLPVVATPESYGWFPLEEGVNACVARSWSDFRELCIELLSDASKRARMGARAREMVKNSLSYEQVGERMIAVFEDAIRCHAARREAY